MAERFYYVGNDDRPIEIPASANITPYNEDGSPTQELKDYIALQREQGNYASSATTTISRPTQRETSDSIMAGVVPSKAEIERFQRTQSERNIENRLLEDQRIAQRRSEASAIYARGLGLPDSEEPELEPEEETSSYTEIVKGITKAGVNTGILLTDIVEGGASLIDKDDDWFGATPEEREERRRRKRKRRLKPKPRKKRLKRKKNKRRKIKV